MPSSDTVFPRRLLTRFLLWQAGLLIPIGILTTVGTKLYVDYKIKQLAEPAYVTYPLFVPGFVALASVILLAYLTITAWTAWRLILPLQKALDGLRTDLHKQGLSRARDEEELQAIMGGIEDAIVAVDAAGNLRFYNSQFAMLFRRFGLQRTRFTMGELFRDPQLLDCFRGVLRDGSSRSVEELLLEVGEPAERRIFRLKVSALPAVKGSERAGVIGVFHDITDLKRADRVRIDFVANVSHELRTPLTSIKGYAETLKSDLGDTSPTAAKYLTTVERNADRLIALVTDLLHLSSLESGDELEHADTDLSELTDRVVAQFESRLKQKGLEVRIQLGASKLHADPRRLEQVVFNLLDNAIKYNTTGKRIEIDWQAGAEGVSLHVRDDGPGIAREHHDRLFERFYRVDPARNRGEQGGTGLGLAIVKHIVQRHGGHIQVKGDAGQGTEFICSFPKN